MQHVSQKCINLWSENLEERDELVDYGVEVRIILK
jgi:hypothetical protein